MDRGKFILKDEPMAKKFIETKWNYDLLMNPLYQ